MKSIAIYIWCIQGFFVDTYLDIQASIARMFSNIYNHHGHLQCRNFLAQLLAEFSICPFGIDQGTFFSSWHLAELDDLCTLVWFYQIPIDASSAKKLGIATAYAMDPRAGVRPTKSGSNQAPNAPFSRQDQARRDVVGSHPIIWACLFHLVLLYFCFVYFTYPVQISCSNYSHLLHPIDYYIAWWWQQSRLQSHNWMPVLHFGIFHFPFLHFSASAILQFSISIPCIVQNTCPCSERAAIMWVIWSSLYLRTWKRDGMIDDRSWLSWSMRVRT